MEASLAQPTCRRPWWQQHLLTRAFRHSSTLLLLLIVLGLGWRAVRYGLNFPMFGDEAFVAVNYVERDFAGLTKVPLQYTQIVPLGFSWAEEAVSRLLGLSEYALRLLPFLAGLAAFLLLWRLARRMLDRRAALLAVAIAAASYYLVRHGAEVKAYTTDCLLSLALTSLAWSIHTRGRSLAKWAALAAVGALAVWMSFPAAFTAGGVGLFLAVQALRRRDRAALASLAAVGLAIGASFAGMYLLYAKPMAGTATWYWEIPTWQDSFPPILKPWLIPVWLLRVHAGAMMAYPTGGNDFGSAGTLLLVLVGCVGLWRSRKADVVGLLLLPFAVTLAAAFLGKYPYGGSARVALHLAPAACLLAGAGLSFLIRRLAHPRLAPDLVRLFAIVLGAFAVFGAASDIVSPFKRDSHRQARETVRKFAKLVAPSDRVLLCLAKEHSEDDRPLPAIIGTDSASLRYALETKLPAPLLWAPDVLKPSSAKRTWLLYYAVPRVPSEPQRAAQFATYLAKAEALLGPSQKHEYRLKEPHGDAADMSLQAYLFPSPP